jgi:hypothetical protein
VIEKKQALLTTNFFGYKYPSTTPLDIPSHLLKLSSPSFSELTSIFQGPSYEPTSILQGTSDLLKVKPCERKMVRGKNPHFRSTIAPN